MIVVQMENGLVPERSLLQRKEALLLANEVRTWRAQLKFRVRAGHESVLDVILEPPALAETMKVSELLLAAPKLGRVKVNKVLSVCRISPSKTLVGLTERQRVELVGMLRR